jgi:hypothetical protein
MVRFYIRFPLDHINAGRTSDRIEEHAWIRLKGFRRTGIIEGMDER